MHRKFTFIAGKDQPLTDAIRDHIKIVGPRVNRRLSLTAELLDTLQSHKVIIERHRQCIDGKPEPYKKKMELLEILPRRSDRAFQIFLHDLDEMGNNEAASLLRRGSNFTIFLFKLHPQ